MKIVSIILLVTTLICGCCQCVRSSNETRLNLIDLDEDVLAIIFEFLDLNHMIVLLDAIPHEKLLTVANGSFRRKYNNYEITVDIKMPGEEIYKHPRKDQFYVTYLKAIKIMEYFGGVMPHLEVEEPLPRGLDKYIVNYTRNGLIRLNIHKIDVNTFVVFDKPFDRLEELSFTVCDGMRIGSLKFSEIFPSLKRLHINSLDNYFVEEFTHLEHLVRTSS